MTVLLTSLHYTSSYCIADKVWKHIFSASGWNQESFQCLLRIYFAVNLPPATLYCVTSVANWQSWERLGKWSSVTPQGRRGQKIEYGFKVLCFFFHTGLENFEPLCVTKTDMILSECLASGEAVAKECLSSIPFWPRQKQLTIIKRRTSVWMQMSNERPVSPSVWLH